MKTHIFCEGFLPIHQMIIWEILFVKTYNYILKQQ